MNQSSMKVKQKLNNQKLTSILLMSSMFIMSSGFCVFADGDYGKNASSWLTEQGFWIAAILVMVGVVKCLAKKAWSALVGVIVLGGVVLVLAKDPTKLEAVGSVIWTKIFGG